MKGGCAREAKPFSGNARAGDGRGYTHLCVCVCVPLTPTTARPHDRTTARDVASVRRAILRARVDSRAMTTTMSCDDTAQVVVRLDDDAPWMSKASTSEGDESVEMGENTDSDANELGRRARVEECVRDILHGLGEDVAREGLLDTPKRVAKALTFAMRGYGASATAALGTALFHEENLASANASVSESADALANGTHDIVLVRDIPVFSTCAKTFMPFYGVIHVGYVPKDGVIVGLSKLARVAEVYARRLQTPSALTMDVAQALHDVASPLGVGVAFTGMQLGPFAPRRLEGRASTGCFATTNSVWWHEFQAMVALGGEPSDLSRGVWGDMCGVCDGGANADAAFVVNTASASDGAEAAVDATATQAANDTNETVYNGVLRLLCTLDLNTRVQEATGGKMTAEDTARRFSSLLAAMRSGNLVPFSRIEESARGDARDASSMENVSVDGEVRVMSDLHMSTVCEHHLLPFHGTVSVAYCSTTAVTLSRDTLQALVSRHSRRLQVQERLTRDVAEEIYALTGGVGVMVAARAAHLCMVSRGVEKPGSSTCTVTKLGRFACEPKLRSEVWERLI